MKKNKGTPSKSFKFYEVRYATEVCGTSRTQYAYLKAFTQDGAQRQAKRSGIKDVRKIKRISKNDYQQATAGKVEPAPKPVVRPAPPPPPARRVNDYNGC